MSHLFFSGQKLWAEKIQVAKLKQCGAKNNIIHQTNKDFKIKDFCV